MQNVQNVKSKKGMAVGEIRRTQMERSVGVTEARINFAEIIDSVRYQGDTVLLVKSGKPAAVVVPVEMFERWKEERKEKFEALRRLQARVTEDISEEEAMELALEAQQAVRGQTKDE
jgi:prevent-host-death family protein